MKITLTSQQKLQLEQMHDNERDSRVCDRIKAVLLTSEGWNQTMISPGRDRTLLTNMI